MSKQKRLKINRKMLFSRGNRQKIGRFSLPEETKNQIFGVIMFLIAVIITLSFFNLSGKAGQIFTSGFLRLIGGSVFLLPLFFVLGGMIFFFSSPIGMEKTKRNQVFLGICFLIIGISGLLSSWPIEKEQTLKAGGLVGNLLGWPFQELFGILVTNIIFSSIILIGVLVIFQLFNYRVFFRSSRVETPTFLKEPRQKETSFIKKIFEPRFKVKEITTVSPLEIKEKVLPIELKTKPIEPANGKTETYQPPPLDLLETDQGSPTVGDIRINSAIIKKTLQNFDIPVEMSEVNIGPTVTQYTLKPAEGIKLSRITALNNDLTLALSASSIRIEAPIPGRPLVGIEVPNKVRTLVRLRDLIGHPNFQNSPSNLVFSLGRDVSGNPAFADLSRMPHLLVAGSTGTGKTICLNTLITSLLYRNSPETLRLILIDPKRVEFPIYNDLSHLLCPVIFDSQKTVNVLKWLVLEMERRFDILSKSKTRDIASYNEKANKEVNEEQELMPYIVLIVDELADLMAARGREVEAGIVRLAQMARAVGIHLVVATQRPSVEVITGLIKANITSRVTFQVASQVDSRTVLDMAGAEKLLGMGDLLFISAETAKPRRIQGAYISDKEVKRVVSFINAHQTKVYPKEEIITEDVLSDSAVRAVENGEGIDFFTGEEDPLYEEAKRTVIEARKASASLLQRRLRIGYARAARLIDTLEERGVVGPGEGAKPREIYLNEE